MVHQVFINSHSTERQWHNGGFLNGGGVNLKNCAYGKYLTSLRTKKFFSCLTVNRALSRSLPAGKT